MDEILPVNLEFLRKKWPTPTEAELEDLLNRCKNNDKDAWNELFERFMGLIIKTVNETFKRRGRKDLLNKRYALQGVLTELVERFQARGGLNNLEYPLALPGRIRDESRDRTMDWLRKQKRKKSVFRKKMETRTESLDKPISADGNLRLADTLSDSNGEMEEKAKEAAARQAWNIMQAITSLGVEERLLIKILYMFYERPDDKDVRLMAEKTKVSPQQIRSELNVLMDGLVKKNQKRIEDKGKEIRLWYAIRELEGKVRELRLDSNARTELSEIENEIETKRAKYLKLRKRNRAPVRPAYKEIAAVLGMDGKSVKRMSLKIHRLKKMLQSRQELHKGVSNRRGDAEKGS